MINFKCNLNALFAWIWALYLSCFFNILFSFFTSYLTHSNLLMNTKTQANGKKEKRMKLENKKRHDKQTKQMNEKKTNEKCTASVRSTRIYLAEIPPTECEHICGNGVFIELMFHHYVGGISGRYRWKYLFCILYI